MRQFISFGVSGLTTAAIYAIAASGLVLTYTTTGTFNFAHGATGMIAAFAYWQLRFGWHWPAPLALAMCLLVLAPLFGALLDVVIMRGLRGTAETTRLVVTIGLLVSLLGAALWIWKPSGVRPSPMLVVCCSAESLKVSTPCAAISRNGAGGSYWKRMRPGRWSQAVPCDKPPSPAT